MNENYFQIMYPRYDCNYIIYWEYLKKWMIDVCWVFLLLFVDEINWR